MLSHNHVTLILISLILVGAMAVFRAGYGQGSDFVWLDYISCTGVFNSCNYHNHRIVHKYPNTYILHKYCVHA